MSLLLALLAPSAVAATITVDPSGGADHTSLSSAIAAASSGDTLSLAAGTYTGPFDTNGKSLTIDGAGVTSTILTASSSETVLTVDSGEVVDISDLTLHSALQGLEVRGSTASLLRVHVTDHAGRTPGAGAGVSEGGTLTVTSSVFARNEASGTYSGGGIYVSDSTLTVDNSTFRDNAAGQGGALYIDDSVAVLTDATLEGNIASTHGGAIRVRYDASLTATRLSATANTAGGRGGGISAYQADVAITDGTFSGNQAGSNGGALHLDQTSTTAVSISADITDNTATTTGGGIHADTITIDFTGTLSDNVAGADSDGGGLYAIAADVTLFTADISGNTAGTGAGIYSFYGGSLDLEGVTLDGNTAELEGGGIYTKNPLTLASSTVSANSAGSNGGGLAILSTGATVTDTAIDGNTSGDAGGGIYANDADLTFAGAVPVTGSEAVFGGGIAVAGSGAETIDFGGGQVISGNTATGEGGGIFLSNLLSVTLDGSELSDNQGGVAGGGARLADLAAFSALDVVVHHNTAEHGAGFHLSGIGTGETAYGRFTENVASAAGGGILAQNPDALHPLHHLQFIENDAPEGSALYLFNDTATLHPFEFSDVVANTGDVVSLRQSPGARVSHVSAAFNAGVAFETDATSAATVQLLWNASWDNTDHFGGALPALIGVDGNIEADPDYTGVTPDGNSNNELLILGSNSGTRDMGDPTRFDLDSSQPDIGHLGGPDARDQDYDGDGVFISGGDCDDAAADTHPGAPETWYDGEDNDCLGGDDYDADGDGFQAGEDCDDTDASVHPDAIDDTADGTDQDCDGDDGPGGSGDGGGSGGAEDDLDLDSDGIPESLDCDDSDATAFPGNVETCGDGVDNDCDGFVDDFDNDCTGKAGDRACSVVDARGVAPVALLALVAVAGRRRKR